MAAKQVEYDGLEKLPQDIRRWFKDSKKARIFITGRPGVGKSTLINALLGVKIAKTGNELHPETSKVKGYKKKIGGIKMKVWDSPGLQDGTSKDDRYLAQIKRKCKKLDICIYCISFTELRFTENCDDILIMQNLTKVFGKELWDHALFVLTFANAAEHMDPELMECRDHDQRSRMFGEKVQLWKRELTRALMRDDIGVEEVVASSIEVVPAGETSQPALLDRDHWLSPIWFAALYAMNPRAQPAMIKFNQHRIVNDTDSICKEDLEKFLQQQPIIYSKCGAMKTEPRQLGETAGYNYGIECRLAMTFFLKSRRDKI